MAYDGARKQTSAISEGFFNVRPFFNTEIMPYATSEMLLSLLMANEAAGN